MYMGGRGRARGIQMYCVILAIVRSIHYVRLETHH